MAERDRDEAGRPRSRRPRDSLGRPLPRGSEGIARIPDSLELPPVETLVYAQDLLDRGLAFNAHEVLEAAWKNGPDEERTLWQGLAQLAVGIAHVQRGNLKGAITLLGRASSRLASDDVPAPYAIDAEGLADFADALIDNLAHGAEITAECLRPRLLLSSNPTSQHRQTRPVDTSPGAASRAKDARLSTALSSELSSAQGAKGRHSHRFLIPADPALTIGAVNGCAAIT